MSSQPDIKNKIAENHKVSVIIPTYRRDALLKKALLSVVEQTYENIEIIVIDDNANAEWNKKAEEIIDEISLIKPIYYIKNETNKGSAETKNIGIRAATGDYISFLDDDDIYLPDKIRNQLKHMLEEKSEFSVTDLLLYDENNKLNEKRIRTYLNNSGKNDLLKNHLMHHITGTDTLMFKRDYLLRIGGFPPINVGDEFHLMLRAIEHNGIFSYMPGCDVKAYVHTTTDGISIGESKINGENELFEYKKKYFKELTFGEKRYIAMRHYAVLAFSEIRCRRYLAFMVYAAKSFFSSPIGCLRLLMSR